MLRDLPGRQDLNVLITLCVYMKGYEPLVRS